MAAKEKAAKKVRFVEPGAPSTVNTAARAKLPIKTGAVVRVSQKIREADGKTRLQAYEGLVIAKKHGTEAGATFTVRRVASGVGMEKIFPLYSPNIEKIDVLRQAKVRKAKLYYVRDKSVKDIRRKMKGMADVIAIPEPEPVITAPEAAEVVAE